MFIEVNSCGHKALFAIKDIAIIIELDDDKGLIVMKGNGFRYNIDSYSEVRKTIEMIDY